MCDNWVNEIQPSPLSFGPWCMFLKRKTPYMSVWFLNCAILMFLHYIVSRSWPLTGDWWSDGSLVLWNLAFSRSSSSSSRNICPLPPDPDKSEESGRKKWLDLVPKSCFEFLCRDSYWAARGMECFEMTERGNALKFIMSGTFVSLWYIGSISACLHINILSSFRIPLRFFVELFITVLIGMQEPCCIKQKSQ